MKFALYHDRKKQFLSLPNAALKLAELHEEAKLTADVEPGSIVLLRDEMTAQEMADSCEIVDARASRNEILRGSRIVNSSCIVIFLLYVWLSRNCIASNRNEVTNLCDCKVDLIDGDMIGAIERM